MVNNSDLDKYFPAGSADLNAVKQRIESLEQAGTLTEDSPIFTRREFNTAMKKMNRNPLIYFICGLLVGVIGIIVNLFVSCQ